jgi:hypothetical protein
MVEELRFEHGGDYSGCRFAIGVIADIGNAVMIKSVSIDDGNRAGKQ